MRFYKRKNQLLVVYLVIGFFVGIIYENIVAKREVVISEIFLKNNLELYLNTTIVRKEYVIYIIKKRFVLFAVVGMLGCVKWKRGIAVLLLGFTGFCLGTIVVLSVLQVGIGGIVLSIGSILPHSIFYGIAGAILLSYWYRHPNGRWSYIKSVFLAFMLICAIIIEIYVTPIVTKWFIHIIC